MQIYRTALDAKRERVEIQNKKTVQLTISMFNAYKW